MAKSKIMRHWGTLLFSAMVLLMLDVHGAFAQGTRYWDRRVEAGKEIEFQWLNYDETSCKDRGHPRLIINTPPSLGKFRAVPKTFTQQNGRCKGSKFSVLLVYYVAGRTKGSDRTSFTIRGNTNIRINLDVRVY